MFVDFRVAVRVGVLVESSITKGTELYEYYFLVYYPCLPLNLSSRRDGPCLSRPEMSPGIKKRQRGSVARGGEMRQTWVVVCAQSFSSRLALKKKREFSPRYYVDVLCKQRRGVLSDTSGTRCLSPTSTMNKPLPKGARALMLMAHKNTEDKAVSMTSIDVCPWVASSTIIIEAKAVQVCSPRSV